MLHGRSFITRPGRYGEVWTIRRGVSSGQCHQMSQPLITVSRARELVLQATGRLESERVEIAGALNRVLAEDVVSADDVPPFPCSAMDGFAIRAGDAGRTLRSSASRGPGPRSRARRRRTGGPDLDRSGRSAGAPRRSSARRTSRSTEITSRCMARRAPRRERAPPWRGHAAGMTVLRAGHAARRGRARAPRSPPGPPRSRRAPAACRGPVHRR